MIDTYLAAIVVVAMALLTYRLLFRRRRPRPASAPTYRAAAHRKTTATHHSDPRFRAVSCSGHCHAVREIRDKRFLEREAPTLPLPGCSESRCQCVYIHHDDRRSGRKDRRGISHIAQEFRDYAGKAERRLQRGRRATDLGSGLAL